MKKDLKAKGIGSIHRQIYKDIKIILAKISIMGIWIILGKDDFQFFYNKEDRVKPLVYFNFWGGGMMFPV